MIINRTLLFLDEPTSGLDGQSSYIILQFLRKLAEYGQAILCTIHQPSAALFAEFDSLLLLKGGGKVSSDMRPKLTTDCVFWASQQARRILWQA